MLPHIPSLVRCNWLINVCCSAPTRAVLLSHLFLRQNQFTWLHLKECPALLCHILPLSLPPVLLHCGRHPAALFLHVHVCLDVRRGPSHLPHADRAAQHQLRRHEVLLCHRLGRPCHHHRLVCVTVVMARQLCPHAFARLHMLTGWMCL